MITLDWGAISDICTMLVCILLCVGAMGIIVALFLLGARVFKL